ncbi:MAG: M14 family metallopeptidase [Candidatus Pacebacteria bacterium]|jgi:hypothetical protein|nr:M14 family metallopeptidase [Candidatus Paceibacterota bacterium]
MKPKTLKFAAILVSIAALGAAMFWLVASRPAKVVVPVVETPKQEVATTTVPEAKVEGPQKALLGVSVEGRKIEAYTFGGGKKKLVFVGGVHGGYEWNSVLLAYKFIDYLTQNPDAVPAGLSVAVIPAANPDGLFRVIKKEGRFVAGDVPAGTNGDGRFNSRGVDLNRNFDCNWQAQGVWQNKTVSGGAAAFSEPETKAIRDYVLANKPAATVFWHSKSGTVYGSGCNSDMLPTTEAIMNAYAKAAGYKSAPTFADYKVNGDATDWMASKGMAAITVELATHESTEWDKNLAGIKALFWHFEGSN